MRIQRKVKAAALAYAVFVVILITIMMGTLMLSSFFARSQFGRLDYINQIYDDLESAMTLVMAGKEPLDPGQQRNIQLENDRGIETSSQRWGVYEVLSTSYEWKKEVFSKTVLLGERGFKELGVALYLLDKNKPLSLCGDARLNGNCYLPEIGVKRAYIEGKSFNGKKLVAGLQQKSANKLPELDNTFKAYLQSVCQGNLPPLDSIIYTDEKTELNINHPFNRKPLGIELLKSEELKGSVSGNVIIYSSQNIILGRNAIINDVLISAPKIIIEGGFKGKVQCFASQEILIESGAQLDYPSAMVVAGEGAKQIKFEKDSYIKGSILFFNEKAERSILIEKDSYLEGQLYTNALIELKGKVDGSVYCSGFSLHTPSGVYENHLLDGQINFDKLYSAFIGIDLFGNNTTKDIIKCLN